MAVLKHSILFADKRLKLMIVTLLTCLSFISKSQTSPIVGGTGDDISGMLYLTKDDNSEKTKIIRTRTVDEKDFVSVIPKGMHKYGEANIFLFKNNRNNSSAYDFQHFIDSSSSQNTYKKINDSLYEIYITDPRKEVLFVTGKLNKNYGKAIVMAGKGGLNSPNLMGDNIDSLIVKNQTGFEYYKVQSYNPFIYGLELSVWDKRTSIGHPHTLTFKIFFQFPKPYLLGITTDTSLIRKKKRNPSLQWYENINKSEDTSSGRVFSHNKNSILFSFKHLDNYHRTLYLDNLQYKLDNVSDWTLTPLSETPSVLLENISAGKHTFYVKYPPESSKVFEYHFTIKSDWKDSPLWYILLGIIVSAIIFFFIFRTRLKRAKEKAQKTKLELQAIQAQLNPHFMFNVLGSIQYLVNDNDKEKANHYLNEFSGLLRNSLYNNEQEMVPLSKELQTMESYIQLEQLRFKFIYHLHMDENIQPENISIPTLLIQPMIENAIKHGISSLSEEGRLSLAVSKEDKNLVIIIEDNGKGFDTEQAFKGFGIKLVKERIIILNRKNYKIDLSILIDKGTTVRFEFKNWM